MAGIIRLRGEFTQSVSVAQVGGLLGVVLGLRPVPRLPSPPCQTVQGQCVTGLSGLQVEPLGFCPVIVVFPLISYFEDGSTAVMRQRLQRIVIRAAAVADQLPQQCQLVQRFVVPVLNSRPIEEVCDLQSLQSLGGGGERHESSRLREVFGSGLPKAGGRARTKSRACGVSLQVVGQAVEGMDAVLLAGSSHFPCERARNSPAWLISGVQGTFEPGLAPLGVWVRQ